MIWTVSTVKDTAANVHRFVDRNLGAGADHMFVFLDDGDEQIYAELTARPHVTPVNADEAYWTGTRPQVLNRRQRVNANLVNALLAPIDPGGWLFHIDGDECLDIDREAVEALDPTITQITLPPREAASVPTGDGGEDTRFKPLLAYEELVLLTALGVIDQPSNSAYFTGHVHGKPGLRPRVDLYAGIHCVSHRGSKQTLPAPSPDGCGLLHYECHSAEEFVRKWSQHVAAGITRVRPHRSRILAAVTAVNRNTSLDEQRKRELLHGIYHQWVADDTATLAELGLLNRADPRLHDYGPRALPPEQVADICVLLPRLLATRKWRYVGEGAELGITLTRLAAHLHQDSTALAQRLAGCLQTAGMFQDAVWVRETSPGRQGIGPASLRPWVPAVVKSWRKRQLARRDLSPR